MTHDRLLRLTLALLALAAAFYVAQGVTAFLTVYGSLLMVFLLGWLLAFILNPLVRWLTRPGLPRRGRPAGERRQLLPWGVAVLLVYLAIVAVGLLAVLAVVPRLIADLGRMAQEVPDITRDVAAVVDKLALELGVSQPEAVRQTAIGNLTSQIASLLDRIIGGLTGLIQGTAALVVNIILVLVFGLYLNLGGTLLLERVMALVPRRWRDEAWVLSGDVSRAFGGFLRGQTIYAAISAAIVAVAMVLVGAPLVLAAAIGTFLLSLIPLFGSFLGLIPPILAGLTVSPQTALLLLVVLGGIQLVLTNAVMPKIFGTSIAMEPVVVFVAIVVGINVAGLWGAIFAIPLTAIAILTLQYLTGRRTDVPAPDFHAAALTEGVGEEGPGGTVAGT